MPSLKCTTISQKVFTEALLRYDSIVPERLQELDNLRYGDIPDKIAQQQAPVLNKDQVEKLVEWKLKHGTFRPKLLQLVQSNDAATIIQATQDAFDIVSTYSGKQFSNTNLCTDALKALKILTALKGIGPATASLLLSIAVPGRIPFFSDELFRWCMWDEPGTPNGWKRAIKYNAKEYEALIKNVDDLVNRLGVRAVDAEKVAYVLGKEGADIGIEGDGERAVDSKDSGESVKDEIDKEPVPLEKPKRGTKRKATASKPQTEGTRKSARTKR